MSTGDNFPIGYHVLFSCGPAQVLSAFAIPALALAALVKTIKYVAIRCMYQNSQGNCTNQFVYSDVLHSRCGTPLRFVDLKDNLGNAGGGAQAYCAHEYNKKRLAEIVDYLKLCGHLLLHCIPIAGGLLGGYVYRI